MPKAVHDLAIKLQGKGKSEDSAWAIANSQLGKTTKNDKNVGELMDQSPSMTNLRPSPQNTAGWPTSQNPSFANEAAGGYSPPNLSYAEEPPCDICGGPEHPPLDHPFLPRMPNDPMAMTQMPQMPMQPPMPQMPQQPPMQPGPGTQTPPNQEGGMGSGQYPHGGGGGPQQAPSGGGQSGGGDGGSGGGDSGGFGGGQGGFGGGGKPPPGPIMSFETVKESIFKQLLDRKVGCGCRKSKSG